ncbi:MAG: hypothetical protein IKS56_08290 [Lachnospiraceae bacterium]|nr:hypothetical protein [Lachnospiraceae bacterium]
MKYEELYKDFISIFPEDSDFFEEKSRENDAEESDGMHIMFGLVVLPYIKKIIQESPEKSVKAFSFFEDMEKSGDSKIAEVLEFSILEYLLSNEKESIDLYAKYFGPETTEAAKSIGKWFSQK